MTLDGRESPVTLHQNQRQLSGKTYFNCQIPRVLQALGSKTQSRSDATRMGSILKAKGLVKTGRKYQMPAENNFLYP
jgi:hypothetical protein